ncbi:MULTISPECIES: MBL fold metallo-hydrolase [Sinorhizobium]|uniref:MBL fold metallo-hydrolase n=2 Tax=Sinorhizobium TaxID=28105 RepID=A0A2S3YTJ6_9HYPH|nr:MULTISPECIES: MBL fold metallo-hydrolase [Sinorhizobium]AUX80582.1 metallo-beta-lactamase family hydrolase protein [Sinorhizobium fredii]PDT37517.1 MBL fold metallo-hydrolase [Sinorhizobium sp. FG01]POH34933.1 MBL fold metallo-hydrolase [Sinorhizobium americanum]
MAIIDREELLHLLDRRRFLIGSAALASISLMPWKALALSAAPYRFMQGDFEVIVLSDGSLRLPLNIMATDASPEQLADIAKRLGWSSGKAEPAANIPLLRKGSDLILIDNGSGNKFQPTAGKLAENLKAAGIEPGAVTKVVFTHAHPDHIWGTLTEGNKLFLPNATYFVGSAEWNFWTDPGLLSKMPAEMADFVKGAQRDLGAVKGRVTMVKGSDEIVPGLSVLDTPGHTPGHISLEVAGGEGLIIAADAMSNEIISFEHPEWKFGFDAQPDLAIENRKKLLDRAATDKVKMLGYHWTYPGVGFAERRGPAYVFARTS